MEKKQSVEGMVAEMRVLSELAGDVEPKEESWLSPSFWTMATAALTNLITVAALIGWIDSTKVEGITQALAAVLGAAQVIVVNSVLVWKYIAGQNAVQKEKIAARYHYMETVAVEKLRAK